MNAEPLPRHLALVCAGKAAGLDTEGRRRALTAAGKLALSRWSWIATAGSAAAEQTARAIAVEFPYAPVLGFDPSGAEAPEALQELLDKHHGDGVIVSCEDVLSGVVVENCRLESARLESGAVVILRQIAAGWEVARGATFGLAVPT